MIYTDYMQHGETLIKDIKIHRTSPLQYFGSIGLD